MVAPLVEAGPFLGDVPTDPLDGYDTEWEVVKGAEKRLFELALMGQRKT